MIFSLGNLQLSVGNLQLHPNFVNPQQHRWHWQKGDQTIPLPQSSWLFGAQLEKPRVTDVALFMHGIVCGTADAQRTEMCSDPQTAVHHTRGTSSVPFEVAAVGVLTCLALDFGVPLSARPSGCRLWNLLLHLLPVIKLAAVIVTAEGVMWRMRSGSAHLFCVRYDVDVSITPLGWLWCDYYATTVMP